MTKGSDPFVRRLVSQMLAGPRAGSAVEVAARLLAIQGQDARGARLAVRARSCGLTAADVDRALGVDRTLVITWLNRGTLHLVRSEDYPWLRALTTPPLLTGNARRLAQEGVSPDDAERGVRAVVTSLEEEGPLTRPELRERVGAAGVRTEGQALVHVLALAALRGLVVRGPVMGAQHAYALVRDWLEPPGAVDIDAAMAELARRYLAGHGPAGERDLAKWAGLPLRDVRRGMERIAPELVHFPDGTVDLRDKPESAERPAPRLLGAFEPLLLGWRDRGPVLGPHAGAVVAGGIFRPIALVGGRAVATWRLDGATVRLDALEAIAPADRRGLAAEAEDVRRFLGLEGLSHG